MIRTASPELELEDWKTIAKALIDSGGGVLAVTAPDRLLHGVATYEIVENPWFGQILKVGTLAAFELVSGAPVRTLLTATLRHLSDAMGCAATVKASHSLPSSRKAEVAI